jgi:hypothetical protein
VRVISDLLRNTGCQGREAALLQLTSVEARFALQHARLLRGVEFRPVKSGTLPRARNCGTNSASPLAIHPIDMVSCRDPQSSARDADFSG